MKIYKKLYNHTKNIIMIEIILNIYLKMEKK